MKLLVDGVFFSLARSGITRVWTALLRQLVRYPAMKVVLLDRGECPAIEGVERIEFPSYSMNALNASDSLLLDEVARKMGADVFMSTYYTTPVSIPSVMMVYDMIPEVLEFDLTLRPWREKQLAISFARYFACISDATRRDLGRFYPETRDRAVVAPCGVERDIFRPRGRDEIEKFRRRFELLKPYYLLVGAREQAHGYKNGSLVFRAARLLNHVPYEIVCIGGERQLDRASVAGLPRNISARRLGLEDDELALAYAGAEALIYPSLYEGFGMPVVEAMACGCPVISTRHGALAEVCGDAAVIISGKAERELARAMESVRQPEEREHLVEKGMERAAQFEWQHMSAAVHKLLERARDDARTPEARHFFRRWKELRTIQAEIDVFQPGD